MCVAFVLLLSGCAAKSNSNSSDGDESNKASFKHISQDKAMGMMEKESGYIILDVRTKEEFEEGHIKNAINIPNETIGDSEPKELRDKDQIILVYCRSGNRSKQASKKLAKLGYTNIYEFGGINSWKGEIVRD